MRGFGQQRYRLYQMHMTEEEQHQQKENHQKRMSMFEKLNESSPQSIHQLEEWTSLSIKSVLFDSSIDNWTINKSVFNKRIIEKSQLLFLIEDIYGNRFGYYLNTQIKLKKYQKCIPTDNKSFFFILESNGRLEQPVKFDIKDTRNGGIMMERITEDRLIELGDIVLFKRNKKDQSFYLPNDDRFNSSNISYGLIGKKAFIPERILVIQMH